MLGIAHSDLTSRCSLSLFGCTLLETRLKPVFFSNPNPRAAGGMPPSPQGSSRGLTYLNPSYPTNSGETT